MTPVVLLAMQLVGATPWTIADMENAKRQGFHAELLDRALEVGPAGRNEAWQGLVVESAAAVVSKAVPTAKEPLSVVDRATGLIERFPFLEKAPTFVAARDQAVVGVLKVCRERDDERCIRDLEVHLKALSGKSAFEAAKVMRQRAAAWAAMVFVRQAVVGEASLCKEPLVKEVTLAALSTPEDGAIAKDARQVAFETCWDTLKAPLKEAMVGASSYYMKNSCASLRAKKALSDLQDELCKDEDL